MIKLADLETSFSSISADEKIIIDTMAELYAERIKSNVSQQELAERIGMKQPQVAKLEMLESVPTLKTLNRYAKGLGLKLKVGLVPA
ncbi:helix-turn-helix domain-containing protein [Lactiplantibacillus plantarum]|uniref:helix-turn-helix domain-containing protein n=1 Tax=Lactiplantibacillus plantarum TaxID=1590 RepID=UPI001362D307|nr:helix-turn-helix transcriptional regulator [Lactiplantibacillus plantarum]QHM51206.1 Antitoxin HigA1 [Lactiplantibacillus plantarum]